MTTRIEKDGWVVQGETIDELELGIEAVQRALTRAVKNGRGPGRPPGPTKNGAAKLNAEIQERKDRAIAFLKVIRDAGPEGIRSADLTEALSLGHGREIGGVLHLVNRILESQEIGPHQVYRSEQVYSNTPKTWFPGNQIENAIKAIRKL